MPSPEFATILRLLRWRRANESMVVDEARAELDHLATFVPPLAGVITERTDAGGVAAEWVGAPGARRDCAILYLHGGGYVTGSIDSHRDVTARISLVTGARGLVLGYRLAPENPFPAAVDDAVAAYRWLLGIGLDAARIAVAGDSAGGGLAVAMMVALRDAGDPLPAAGACLSPWVDLEGIGESMTARASLDPTVHRAVLLQVAEWYLQGADPRSPLAAPLYADLTGLPPLLVQVGTAETLHDDATRLTERARACGVEVTLEVWDDMVHGWQLFAPFLPEGQRAIERIGAFLRPRIGAQGTTAVVDSPLSVGPFRLDEANDLLAGAALDAAEKMVGAG